MTAHKTNQELYDSSKELGRFSTIEDTEQHLSETMDEYVSGLTTRRFIDEAARDRGVAIPDMIEALPDEQTFLSAAEDVLDSRKGKVRAEIKGTPYGPAAKAALETVKQELEMTIDTLPQRQHYDAVIIPGGAGSAPRKRLEYIMKLIDEGHLTTNMIIMMGSDRPVNTEPDKKTGKNEIDRAGSGGYNKAGVPATTEAELTRNTIADVLGIADDEWVTEKGYRTSIPEQYHFQHSYDIDYAVTDTYHVFNLSSPMLDNQRHHANGKRRSISNTADTLMMVGAMFGDTVREGETPHVLMSCDAIHKAYQGAEAAARLAAEGVECETIGFSRATAGMPEKTDGEYSQEILSTFKRTRSARDYLRAVKAGTV